MKMTQVLLDITSWIIRVGLALKAFLLGWVLLGFAIFGGMLKSGDLALAIILPFLCFAACLATTKALTTTCGHWFYQIVGLLLLAMPLKWLQTS